MAALRLSFTAASVPKTLRMQWRLIGSVTSNPNWLQKTKERFVRMDLNKDGLVNNDDISILAKSIASYRNEGPEAEKHYFQVMQSLTALDLQTKAYNEQEFIEEMKKFVDQPDAKEQIRKVADMIFDVIDTNKNGVISYEEFFHFYKALGTSDEEIDKFFKEVDLNADGSISRSECQENYIKYFFSA